MNTSGNTYKFQRWHGSLPGAPWPGVIFHLLLGKLNLIGNDGGAAAWAIAGTVRFPTACYEIKPRDYYAGGLSSLFSPYSPCGWGNADGKRLHGRRPSDFVNRERRRGGLLGRVFL